LRKWIIIGSIVVVVGLAGWGLTALAMSQYKSAQAAGLGGVPVRIEAAHRGDLTEIVAAPGTVVPETNVKVSARVNAKIIELPFKVGQSVTKGSPDASPPVPPSVLVRLDATDIEANLRAAEARASGQRASMETALARIEARQAATKSFSVQLENKQTELERQMALLANNDVSKQVVDNLQADVNQLKAQIEGEQGSIAADKVALAAMKFDVDVAQADIDRIKDSLNYTTIVSPIDGTVTVVNVEAGEIAVTGTMNNAGTVLLEVADLNTMLVEARVDETDIASVKAGQSVIVRMEAYPNRKFPGTVQTVALARSTDTTDRSQYYEVKVLIDRGGTQIVSGLTADVEIQTEKHADAMKVPSQAILGRPVESLPTDIREKPEVDPSRTTAVVVYRLVNGKAVVTPVRIGASDLTHTVIESGLTEGDQIVIGPYKVLESIQHDQAIKDEKATTQPTTQTSSASKPSH
jgi:HlyD family secretion protein